MTILSSLLPSRPFGNIIYIRCSTSRKRKLANVVPVHKKDEKDHVETYRPISLLCIISKVLERRYLSRIKERLEELIVDCQHGFRCEQSCVTNLLETLDHIGAILDRAGQVDCVYVDMSKTFDKVRHDLLINKLWDAAMRTSVIGAVSLYWGRLHVTSLFRRAFPSVQFSVVLSSCYM